MLRHFKLLINSVLLFTVSTTAFYPQGNQLKVPAKVQQAEKSHIPSYDEIMRLLEDHESGKFEKSI